METWMPIKGYEKKYEVSNCGRIRITGTPVIRANAITEYGYVAFTLCYKGTVKRRPVHRIVAETFIPNPDNKPEVNHKDGNKQNNNVENLEWCTHLENIRHSIEMGTFKKSKRKPQIT